MSDNYIKVSGARERNLKNINVLIPKKEITVFTGVSGSGKSSLVFDTIAAESQRQLNETYSSFIRNRMPHYGKPDVDSIENLSVAFIINQKRLGGNSRSTVGTITDIYSVLRLLFSRIGKPFVGYSDVFSFNNPAGMCEHCEGLGKIETIDIEKLLDKNKSLNEGAIRFPTFEPGGWRITRYIHSGFFDNNKKLKDYTAGELELLLYPDEIKIKNPTPEWHKTSLYEGLIPHIERSFLKKEDGEKARYGKEIEPFIVKQVCPHCHGTRLNDTVLSCKVNGKNIADHIIDMGPGAGSHGGEIVYQGNLDGLKASGTLTGKYLSYCPKLKSDIRAPRGYLSIQNVTMHNLKNLTVDIPKGVMTVVTGVAGSGKSTLVNGILPRLYPETVFIDQKGIQASKRSNIATFTGIFDIIRKLFAKRNGISASLFSFNSHGACPACKGLGVTYTDLAFMDTIVTVCEECHGNRYTDEVLAYRLRGKSIADVLKMTVEEALDFFQEKEIVTVLKRLSDVGITYVTLGQPLSTLSGGELQRIKLASQLENGGQIYVLDEPSTGLHMTDIKQLIRVMNRLVEQNSTLIVIEHNLDIICQADWIIDIGPYAGQNGGKIMFTGLPKDLINCPDSLTGKHLKKYINEKQEDD